MHILGISCFYHDSAAALLRDGDLMAAAEEERFSRVKHDFAFPENAIRFCLEFAGIGPEDLDYVVFYEKPFRKFERILMTTFQTFPRSWRVFQEAMVTWLLDKLWIKSIIKEKVGVEEKKILFCDHHLSHAASAFFCSPFEDIYIQPAAGDGGGALGAALWAYHSLLGYLRKFIMEHAYWGKSYSEGDIKTFLDAKGIPYQYITDEDTLIYRIVDSLVKGKVVGWYQDRFEWGPRALGNRSILADPRSARMSGW